MDRPKIISRCCALALAAVLVVATGCTHVQLRKNAVRQSGTLSDIHQQQVLNNLAKFVYDYHSLPSFSLPNQGAAAVTDTGNASMTPGFARQSGDFVFNTLGLNFSAARQAQESFTLTPINDPRKLELMRCAYQQAVKSCGCGEVSEHCPDCQLLQKRFYTGDPDGDISARAGGITTSECLKNSPCWFNVCCKKCLPKKKCPCNYIGEYCGVYVYVPPEGRDELTKLTLTILDYAINTPPILRTKQIQYTIDEYGLPTTRDRSVGQVTATINIDERDGSIINAGSTGEEARLEQIIKAQLQLVQERIEAIDKLPPNDPQREERKQLVTEKAALENKLQYINELFRTGALKEKYYPPMPGGISGAALLPFAQQLDTLTPQRPLSAF
jgi:hypothetical protein